MSAPPAAAPPLFTDSRRLLGPSLWLEAPGVVLEVPGPHGHDAALQRAWGGYVAWMCAALGWTGTALTVRSHAAGCSLAFTAPREALMSATSLNEWALTCAADECGVPYDPASLEEDRLPSGQAEALERMRGMLDAERDSPPEDGVALVARDIPTALITGSNGKTTTTRLLAAMLRAAGQHVGFCCSDGVFIDGEMVEEGDWSGPGGARRVLEDPRVTAAVLESARGGLLRRGLVVPRADVAVITNIAADHFGEYGIDSLADIAAAKGVVAQALSTGGTLILGAADPTLRAHPPHTDARLQWFGGDEHASGLLPPLAEMPIAMDGLAAYNIANAEAAACAARVLGVPDAVITGTLRQFGRENADNPGRLERYEFEGRRVWLDYAHNPHGLAALLDLARGARGSGRLGLILGQAGDRPDESLRALAQTAWSHAPNFVVLQEMTHYLRGRAPGEVPGILREALLHAGADASQLRVTASEAEAVEALLAWSAPGDLLVMPVHALEEREALRRRIGAASPG